MSVKLKILVQNEMNSSTLKKPMTTTNIKHNIFIIGDSHVRGLSDKVSSDLDDAFSMTGISKPNADIDGITSSEHFSVDNLTKNYLIIFYGGTKDIGKNEAIKGFHSLKTFAQRTVNTNVILLGAPYRYDLPSFSCVNDEVNLYNKRLHSLSFIFNHVRFFRSLTERMHHTNHGLHLNKKGKNWIVTNLVKEIKDLFLPRKVISPIILPWKSTNENILQLVSAMESLSPGVTIDCQKHGNSIVIADSLSGTDVDRVGKTLKGIVYSQELDQVGKLTSKNHDLQDDVTIRKSTRLKKRLTSKKQDFLW
jgi:hypothetical protein